MKEERIADKTLAAQIIALPNLSWNEIKAKWLQHFGQPLTVNNRRYAIRRLAHRLQEEAYLASGNPICANNAKRIARMIQSGKGPRRPSAPAPTPGTVLTREYDGRLHHVTVLLDGGFDYDGCRFASLSKIAREITGTRWSGPAFFGTRSIKRGERNGE